jgi:hypothetical protein
MNGRGATERVWKKWRRSDNESECKSDCGKSKRREGAKKQHTRRRNQRVKRKRNHPTRAKAKRQWQVRGV